ncbi:MAG: AAA family ATPase [Acidimicrobiia bacterium]
MSGLLVASPSEEFDGKLADVFDNTVYGYRRYWRDGLLEGNSASLVAELTRTDPAVVAIGPGLDDDQALDLVEAFDTHRPDVTVIIVADTSLQLLERALRSGARDVVAPDAPDAKLREAFEQVLDAATRRRSALAAAELDTPSRHVICVLAPKGGTGKTTVSTNLASGLALEAPGEVVIVDLDFQFGDVASALRMTPEHTFADITRAQHTVDVTTVKVFLTAAADTGLYALCAPEVPVDADPITPQHVQHVISLLASEFRYVVIDTGSGLDEGTLSVLKHCTDLVLVTSTDVPSVRATRKEVEMLDLLGLTDQSRHFVVNRADARVGLPVSEVEATVGMQAHVTVPSSRAVPISVNHGTPVLVSERRSNVGEAFSQLVSRFEPTASIEPGFFRRTLTRTKETRA